MVQHPLTNIANIRGTIAEPFIARTAQNFDILFYDFFERSLGGVLLPDQGLNFVDKPRILQHHAMGVEDSPIDFRQPFMHPFFQVLDFRDRTLYGSMELPHFGLRIIGVPFAERVKMNLRMDNVGLTDAEAWRGTDPGEPHAARPAFGFRFLRTLALIDVEAFDRLNHAGTILLMLTLLRL